MTTCRVLNDSAIRESKQDFLQFERYVRPLISLLNDPQADTPFTIGIFGVWGSGKSSLLSMLDEELGNNYKEKFVRVHFNPWMHQKEPNMLVPLLHTLHDTLDKDPLERFEKSAKKIGHILMRLGMDFLLKHMTGNVASLKKLETLEQSYFKMRGMIESEIRRLHGVLQTEVNEIAKDDVRIVIFIDDLDRCDPAQIIDLLEAVKLFLDLRHVFVILAVDKEVINHGIHVKYSKFSFAEGRAEAIGSEYLEKMVQLPLQLFPLPTVQVHDFIKALTPSESVFDHIDILKAVVDPNPRKIKRILNILTVTMAIMDATPGLNALDKGIVTRLVVLQVQSGDLYSEILKQPILLTTLEGVFAGNLRPENGADFHALGDRGEAIRNLS